MAAPRRRSALPAVPPRARRVAVYLARHAWRGTRTATVWAGRNGAQLAVRTGGAAAAPVLQWSRDRAEFGWQSVFACECGDRVPAVEQAAHLATHATPDPARVAVPTGHAVMAAQQLPRRRWVDIEVIREDDPDQPDPAPARKKSRHDMTCRCGWEGHAGAWARWHAPICPEVAALRHQRAAEAVRRALDSGRPQLAAQLQSQLQLGPPPAAPPIPAPAPAVAAITTNTAHTTEAAMIDPTGWAKGSDVLATPTIDPAHYKQEVPAFLDGVARGFDVLMQHFAALGEYLTAAGFDVEGGTGGHLDDVLQHLEGARESAAAAHRAAEEYVSTLPDFSRAG